MANAKARGKPSGLGTLPNCVQAAFAEDRTEGRRDYAPVAECFHATEMLEGRRCRKQSDPWLWSECSATPKLASLFSVYAKSPSIKSRLPAA